MDYWIINIVTFVGERETLPEDLVNTPEYHDPEYVADSSADFFHLGELQPASVEGSF